MSNEARGPFEYLEELPGAAFRRLYAQPSTALAIFRRFLPHLAKTFVMAILFLNDPLPLTDLDTWVRPDSKSQQDHALSVLERLKILSVVQDAERGAAYHVTNPFRSSLRMALTGSGDHRSFGIPGGVDEGDRLSMKALGEFARKQWESILYYVVGNSEPAEPGHVDPSEGAKQLLQGADFVKASNRSVQITQKGFTFLLQEINTQVWSLLIEYLEFAEANLSLDNVDVLSFLFTIGSLQVGQDYSTTTFNEVQESILTDLHDFGIVYWPSQNDTYFYPTPLASAITSDSSLLTHSVNKSESLSSMMGTSSSSQTGFIVIETNYRIYAYTSSPLQIQILSLFTKLSTRYPNMISGRLTKESIQYAISRGITSDQIISYLTAHAHPIMTTGKGSSGKSGYATYQAPILPPTVVDQIRLWQIEGDRMQITHGFLFKNFASIEEYDAVVRRAEELEVLKWKSREQRRFFATRTEQLQQFILKYHEQSRQGQPQVQANGAGRVA